MKKWANKRRWAMRNKWFDIGFLLFICLFLTGGCNYPPNMLNESSTKATVEPLTTLPTTSIASEAAEPAIPTDTKTTVESITPVPTTPSEAEPVETAVAADLVEEIGMVIFVEGDVFMETATGRRAPGLMSVLAQSGTPSAFTVIRNGTTIRVEAGSITIVCYNNRVYRVVDRRTVQVTAQTCNNATPLPPKSVPKVKPEEGVIKTVNDAEVIEGKTREGREDYGNLPIVVSPRNTHLLDLVPEIRWVEVPGSVEYELSLSVGTPLPNIVVTPDEINCVESNFVKDYRICTMPWPVEDWPLEVDIYYLKIGALKSFTSPLSTSESELIVLSAEKAEAVQNEIEAIRSVNLDLVTENLLLAGLFAENKLYSAAIDAYQTVLDAQSAPVVAVTLGDTFRATDLQEFASQAYAEALRLLDAGADDPLVRAAAEFGQGQVEYSFGNFAEAKPHFARAVELYEGAGSGERLDAARNALEMMR